MIPDDLKAKPGDKILDKFKKLVAYIDGQKMRSVDGRVKIHETGNGTDVMLLDKGINLVYDHPLKINLIDKESYRVDEGYVNNVVPHLRTKGRKNKILHKIDDIEDGIGVIPNNIGEADRLWLFSCTFVADQNNTGLISYIECLNTGLLERQKISIDQLILGKSHFAREVDGIKGIYEYYVPMAFMREDRVIHNFCWHNINARHYKIGITNRIIFWPS